MKKIAFSLLLFISATTFGQQYKVKSPQGNIELQISNDSILTYQVCLDGKKLISTSPMGFSFKDETDMRGNFIQLNEARTISATEKWTPVVKNKHAECSVPYNEITLNLQEKSGKYRKMDVTFRVMNDAVAFRYTLYGNMVIGNREIIKELTGYNISQDALLWIPNFAYSPQGSYRSSQEGVFVQTPLKDMSRDIHSGLPGLIKIDQSNWMAILEANIDNFPGLYLGNSGQIKDGFCTIESKLAPLFGEKEDGVKARFFEKTSTPWRVIMLGHNPGKFIESEVLRSLNPDCAIKNTSWIKPGMSAWDHWWSGNVKMEMPVIKQYIDFAAKEGWPYALVDWTWYGAYCQPNADVTKPAPQINMAELIKYAKDRNVDILLWMRSEDANNNDQYKEAFKLYHQWGVKGVKIDFMDRDDQDMVNWYRRIIAEAAKNELLVDFHGAYKPDGIERTYPNMICREGILGEEYYKFNPKAITPEHNVTIAYTRLLAGQMDYTPGGFLNVTKDNFQQGTPTHVTNTRAQELAKFIVYEAPLCVFSDHPKNVYGQVGENFISKVPTTWDDIKFLGGDPDSYVALAKKSGNDWYIGIINNSVGRDISIDLSALPKGKYSLEVWSDGKKAATNATDCKYTSGNTFDSSKKSELDIKLAPAGGYVAILSPIQ